MVVCRGIALRNRHHSRLRSDAARRTKQIRCPRRTRVCRRLRVNRVHAVGIALSTGVEPHASVIILAPERQKRSLGRCLYIVIGRFLPIMPYAIKVAGPVLLMTRRRSSATQAFSTGPINISEGIRNPDTKERIILRESLRRPERISETRLRLPRNGTKSFGLRPCCSMRGNGSP